jgi:hypothetical protein
MKTTQLCHSSYKDISQFHKYKWTLYINFTTKSQGIETHTTVLTKNKNTAHKLFSSTTHRDFI